jgi:hypothetical protein
MVRVEKHKTTNPLLGHSAQFREFCSVTMKFLATKAAVLTLGI